MAYLRGEHVDSSLLHVRRLHLTVDRVLSGRLEDDLHRHIRPPSSGSSGTLVSAREREVARQPRSSGESHRDPG